MEASFMTTAWSQHWPARHPLLSGRIIKFCSKKEIFLKKNFQRTVFTLLRAFDLITWGCILASLLSFPLALYLVAKAEERLGGMKMYWGHLDNSYWYVFGVFLGETMMPTERARQGIR